MGWDNLSEGNKKRKEKCQLAIVMTKGSASIKMSLPGLSLISTSAKKNVRLMFIFNIQSAENRTSCRSVYELRFIHSEDLKHFSLHLHSFTPAYSSCVSTIITLSFISLDFFLLFSETSIKTPSDLLSSERGTADKYHFSS